MNSITFSLSLEETYTRLPRVARSIQTNSAIPVVLVPQVPHVTISLAVVELYQELPSQWSEPVKAPDPFQENGAEERNRQYLKRKAWSQACLSHRLPTSSDLSVCQRCHKGPDKIRVTVTDRGVKTLVCIPCIQVEDENLEWYKYQTWVQNLRLKAAHKEKAPSLEKYVSALREDTSRQKRVRHSSLSLLASTVEKYSTQYRKPHGKSESKGLLSTSSPGQKD
tara:strand:- start:1302 stop:1970 length:669 start_codon:yes stop_codon:yes gene_type:complete